MKISKQERIHAGKFFVLLLIGLTLLVAVISVWTKAVSNGGSWWFLFLGCGAGAVAGGELIKTRMEVLLKLSREARRKHGKD
jgi:hypothetical protein